MEEDPDAKPLIQAPRQAPRHMARMRLNTLTGMGFSNVVALFIMLRTAATFVGVLLCFTPLDPIKALFWSAVVNGVAAVPIMVMIMLMARRPIVMGQFMLTPWLTVLGWIATAAMGVPPSACLPPAAVEAVAGH